MKAIANRFTQVARMAALAFAVLAVGSAWAAECLFSNVDAETTLATLQDPYYHTYSLSFKLSDPSGSAVNSTTFPSSGPALLTQIMLCARSDSSYRPAKTVKLSSNSGSVFTGTATYLKTCFSSNIGSETTWTRDAIQILFDEGAVPIDVAATYTLSFYDASGNAADTGYSVVKQGSNGAWKPAFRIYGATVDGSAGSTLAETPVTVSTSGVTLSSDGTTPRFTAFMRVSNIPKASGRILAWKEGSGYEMYLSKTADGFEQKFLNKDGSVYSSTYGSNSWTYDDGEHWITTTYSESVKNTGDADVSASYGPAGSHSYIDGTCIASGSGLRFRGYNITEVTCGGTSLNSTDVATGMVIEEAYQCSEALTANQVATVTTALQKGWKLTSSGAALTGTSVPLPNRTETVTGTIIVAADGSYKFTGTMPSSLLNSTGGQSLPETVTVSGPEGVSIADDGTVSFGASGSVQISTSTRPLTVMIKVDDVPATQSILAGITLANDKGMTLTRTATGFQQGEALSSGSIGVNNGNSWGAPSTTTVASGIHWLTLTYEHTAQGTHSYLDGDSVACSTDDNGLRYSGSDVTKVTLGGSSWPINSYPSAKGMKVKDVQIYSSRLTAAQISTVIAALNKGWAVAADGVTLTGSNVELPDNTDRVQGQITVASDGSYTVNAAAKVKINTDTVSTYYTNLSDAVAAVGDSEATITLLAETDSAISLKSGQTLVNGNLTSGGVTGPNGYEVVNNNGTYTLVDNTASTWNPTDGNAWSTAANWSTGYVPTQYTVVTFNDGATVSYSNHVKCGEIVVKGTVAITGADKKDVELYGDITGSGTLNINTVCLKNMLSSSISVNPTVNLTNCAFAGAKIEFHGAVAISGNFTNWENGAAFDGVLTLGRQFTIDGGTFNLWGNATVVLATANATLTDSRGTKIDISKVSTTVADSYVKQVGNVYSVETYKTVTFKNDDGTTLQTIGNLRLNDTVTYSGDTPTKAATAQYTYTFTGWTPEVVAVTEDATYTAQFSSMVNSYAVTFINEGVTVQSGDVEYGATPAYTGATPAKESTAEYSYTFAGWTPAIGSVTGAATYTATYTPVKRSYEVTFKWHGESTCASVQYGETPAAPTVPAKYVEDNIIYTFTGWDSEVGSVNGAVTYEAQYDPVPAVAKTGDEVDNYFATLQEALDVGGEVTLLSDVTLAAQAIVGSGKTVTLDMAGFTVSNTVDIWNTGTGAWSLVSVQGGSLTVTGDGTFDAKENDCYAFDVRDDGSLTIVNGTFIGNISAVYVYAGSLDIQGGSFDLHQLDTTKGYAFLINMLDSAYAAGTATATIEGGTFKNWDPQANAAESGTDATDFTADGFIGVDNGDGTYGVAEGYVITFEDYDGTVLETLRVLKNGTPVPTATPTRADDVAEAETSTTTTSYAFDGWTVAPATADVTYTATYTATETVVNYVAQVGGVKYATLQEAFDVGGEVTLLSDVTLAAQAVVGSGKTVTLDMAGFKISNTVDIWNTGTGAWSLVSVQGGSLTVTGDGTFDAKENDCYAFDVRDDGSLTIVNGTFIGNISAVYVYAGSLDILGGSFDLHQLDTAKGYAFLINMFDSAYAAGTAAATIEGGTFTNWDPQANAAESGANATDFTADGFIGVDNGDGTYGVAEGYVITFEDYDGTVLETLRVLKNGTPVPTVSPTRADDVAEAETSTTTTSYAFDGWTVAPATADVTYTATYTATETVVNYVAQVGTTKYETLASALAAAEAGDTVTLLADIDVTSAMYSGDTRFNLWINKSLTIDGDGHTLTVKGRGIGVQGTSSNIDVVFKEMTVQNVGNANGRCIDTRGKLNRLTLDGVTLTTATSSYTGYLQPLTIGGNQSTAATVTIKDSVIETVAAANKGYAITTFNPVTMTVTDSTIRGWACLNIKGPDSSAGSSGSTIVVTGSTLVSANGTPGTTNSFSLIKIEDDNVSVSVTESTINVNGGANTQSIVSFQKLNETNSANCTVALGAGNTVTLEGTYKFASNVDASSALAISGGTFNVAVPGEFCATGYIPTYDSTTGTYGVEAGEYSVYIGEDGYETLAEALADAEDGATLKVVRDIEVTSTVVIDKSVTIDLNGNNIVATNVRALWVKAGTVELTGEGTISANGDGLGATSSVIRVGDGADNTALAKLTVGEGVTVSTAKSYGITTFGKNTLGVELELYGKVIVTSTGKADAAISGNGNKGLASTTITVKEGAVVSAVNGAGIYFPGAGTLTVEGGTITGPTAVYVKSGNVKISGGELTGNGEETAYTYTGDGLKATGDALVVESCGYPNGAPTALVTGGTLVSVNAKAIGCYATTGNSVPKNIVPAKVNGAINPARFGDADAMGIAAGYKLVADGNLFKVARVENTVAGTVDVVSVSDTTLVTVPVNCNADQLINTTNRAEGDILKAYVKSAGRYFTWKLENIDNDPVWTPVQTWLVGANPSDSTKPAAEVQLKKGEAVWVTRVNSSEPVLVNGSYAETQGASTVMVETGYNLVAPVPTATEAAAAEVVINEVVEKSNNTVNDKILVPPTESSAPVALNCKYNESTKKHEWGYDFIETYTDDDGNLRSRKVRKTDVKIPSGTGFWYISGGNKEISL